MILPIIRLKGDKRLEERDTYKYHLKEGKKVIDRGITYDWERREALHQQEHPGSRLEQVGRKTTQSAALRWLHSGGKRRYKKT